MKTNDVMMPSCERCHTVRQPFDTSNCHWKKIKKYKTCNDVILFSVKTQDTCQFYSCQEKSCKWFNTTDIGIQQAIQSNILFKVVNTSILWYFVSFKQNIAEFK